MNKLIKPEGDKKPVYAPVEQSILPGMKRDISQPPKDWRKWTDGRSNKIDSPKYQGPMSGGRIVPPLVDVEGRDIRLGSYQVLRDSRGGFRVVDWSLPLDAVAVDDSELDAGRSRIMGRTVFSTKVGVQRAIRAMVVLHRAATDRALGRPVDPIQCVDLTGKNIMIGTLALCRYTHPGPNEGSLVIVDTSSSSRLTDNGHEVFLKTKSMKEAIKELQKEVRRRANAPAPQKKKRFVGAPISFDTTGMGSSFSSGPFSKSWWERTSSCPEPGSLSWETCVSLYASRGRWCATALLISSCLGDLPEAMVEEAKAAREEFLSKQQEHLLGE